AAAGIVRVLGHLVAGATRLHAAASHAAGQGARLEHQFAVAVVVLRRGRGGAAAAAGERERGGGGERDQCLAGLHGMGPFNEGWKGCGAQASSGMNTSSIRRPNSRAMRNASGRLGSYLPVSRALTVCRDTSRRSASSPWDQ